MRRKHTHTYFKRQIGKIAHDMTLAWLQKGNLKRETESLLKQRHKDQLCWIENWRYIIV